MYTATKTFQLTKPGTRNSSQKKRKSAGGGPPSVRSASTGSVRHYPTPEVMVGRQRSLTADQPRLRRADLLDSRVRQAEMQPRPGRRPALVPRSRSRDQLGERLPSLRARIAEMRALASLFPDSEVSVSDATGSETRTNLMALLRSRSRDGDVQPTPARARRKLAGKPSAVLMRSRHGVHAEGPARGRGRRGALRDDTRSPRQRPPRTPRGHTGYRERSPRKPVYCSPTAAGEVPRSPRHSSSHATEDGFRDTGSSEPTASRAVGRTYTELEPHREEPSEPEPRPLEPPVPVDPEELLAAMPQLPDLDSLLAPPAGGPQNLQRVIHNFLLAKQQASAAASMMNNLRGVIEGMQGQPEGDDKLASPAPAAPQQPPTAAAAVGSPSSSIQLRSVQSQRRPTALSRSAGSGSTAGTSGRWPVRAMLVPTSSAAAVSETGNSWRTVSGSCVNTNPDVRSPPASRSREPPRRVGEPPAAPQAREPPATERSASSASSEGTVYMLPGGSRSQLAAAAGSKQQLDHEASEPESALRSVSEAGLAPEPDQLPLEPDATDDVTQLQQQFHLQQTKLREMEQKNYVLSLAVEGQEKTIRTMSNELQSAKQAVSLEVMHQQQQKQVLLERQPAAVPSDANVLSAQSWPIASTKTEMLPEYVDENQQEAERVNAELERKERELNMLKAKQAALDVKHSFPAKTFSPLPASRQTDQGTWRWRGDMTNHLSGMGGGRTRSTEVYRGVGAEAVPNNPTPLRRHSFTVPPPSAENGWRSQLPMGRTTTVMPAPAHNHAYETRCQELKETVDESLARVKELENQLFELKCNRDRGDHVETSILGGLPGAAEVGAVTTAGTGTGGGGPGGMCKPFPQILRMTELKLQQVYQSLLQEQHKNKLLNKNLHELNSRLEQHSSQTEKLKDRLTSSVEERRALQTRLQQAETAGAGAERRADELRQELHRKQELLSQTSQHLDERIEQAAALSRDLDALRSEAAHEVHVSAERLSEVRAHAAQLESRLARQEAEGRLLRQASQEAGLLTQSERRLRQRVLELQERLETSTATCKQLEGYVVFLKTSYSRMFGTPSPAAGAAFELPASVRDLLEPAADRS